MADCSYHPGKDAVGACVNCGKMVCIGCRHELQEKVYCPPCANKLYVAKADVPTYVPPSPIVQRADPKKASSMLTWGIVLTVILLIIVGIVVALFATGVLEIVE